MGLLIYVLMVGGILLVAVRALRRRVPGSGLPETAESEPSFRDRWNSWVDSHGGSRWDRWGGWGGGGFGGSGGGCGGGGGCCGAGGGCGGGGGGCGSC